MAAIEVGGGRQREIQVITDSNKLAAYKLDITDISDVIEENNQDTPAGRFYTRKEKLVGVQLHVFIQFMISKTCLYPIATDSADNVLRIKDVAYVQDDMADEKFVFALTVNPALKFRCKSNPRQILSRFMMALPKN